MTTTLATRVRDRAGAHPDAVAIRAKRLGIWAEVTWAEYWQTVLLVAHGLLALGVRPGDRVAIHSENRPEWLYADLATVALRGVTVGLYPTNPPNQVRHVLHDSGARILIAEDQEQVDKALEVAGDLPDLEWIVYVEPRGIAKQYTDSRLMSWPDLLAAGRGHAAEHPGEIAERMADAQPDDLATLIYTSGTTGPPKGAMLTIANLEFAMTEAGERDALVHPPPGPRDQLLSYLPLCHVVERLFTTWVQAAAGTQVNFAESVATVPQNLREVRPTILFGVPRIWEKILAGMQVRMAGATWLKRVNFAFWMRVADRIGETLVRTGGRHTAGSRVLYALGWVFLYRALLERLGLGRVRRAVSGAAPIAPEVLKLLMGIGVPIHEAYGMTENSAIATINRPGRIRLGTVGESSDRVGMRIDETTGEILIRHPGVFAGYWRNEAATGKVLDADGWLHTGDVGELVDGTYLRITDRLQDIIITSGGKNIAPSELENALKSSPYVKEAVVVGDRRNYLTALIGIELDTVGDWARRRRLAYTTYRDLAEKPEVRTLVQGVVTDVNGRFANVEQIKRFQMLPRELDHDEGELTATQKVRRRAVHERYASLIESMYSEGSPS
jgi:long-chain acyl-CoA synthetase